MTRHAVLRFFLRYKKYNKDFCVSVDDVDNIIKTVQNIFDTMKPVIQNNRESGFVNFVFPNFYFITTPDGKILTFMLIGKYNNLNSVFDLNDPELDDSGMYD